ncbi:MULTISPECIES: hypothetical protein [unclassified Mycobacterium]|uniref:hypothetical protein n=1 Tax=unclassified Mycobacterium TaxID=2642494 RepID=UPI0012EA22D4|nr:MULTISPECIES: hypothetical protein [unclassified Mycobacterium]
MSGNHGTHDTEAIAFWVLAGIIMVIAFGEALAVLGVVVAILAAIAWIYREVERRVVRSHAVVAPVTHLRPALTGQHNPKTTSVGPRAA